MQFPAARTGLYFLCRPVLTSLRDRQPFDDLKKSGNNAFLPLSKPVDLVYDPVPHAGKRSF